MALLHFMTVDFKVWLDTYLPNWLKPYARLTRLDRPIGTWLLLLPCWWSVALAADRFPDLWLIFLFAVGAIVMRGAGCIINDIYDRHLDAKVERTQSRPLASGEINLFKAIFLLVLLLALGFGVLMAFNRFTIGLGVSALLLVFTYPLMKRVTWWPQLFLGFTFNWGALMGWAAVRDTIGLPTIPLYIAGIFWTLGYDTIYAWQDVADDEQVGIKSTARLLGERSWIWVALFYVLSLIFLIFAGVAVKIDNLYYWSLFAAALYAGLQLILWHKEDPANCLVRFRANRNFGLIVLTGIILGKLL